MVDFSKLQSQEIENPLSPCDIYNSLDRKTYASGPLRPAQEQVLSQWYNEHFHDKDLIVKMHTGEGKTLVGLLMLQAKINAGEGPCLYVCPTIQLAEQVAKDASKFGISFCVLGQGVSELPIEYVNGERIMITHVHKVFNGKSIFGLNGNGENIGALVLDDSHACIDAIRYSFTMRIMRKSSLFLELVTLFRQSLMEQGEGNFANIERYENEHSVMVVPYWDWIPKKSEVLRTLMEYQDDENTNIRFTLPLLQNILDCCSAYISGDRIEICPDYMLTDNFTAFSKARNRILMSATTQDDSFLIKGMGFSKAIVEHPLTSDVNHWSGEKMILFPSMINDISNEALRLAMNEYAKQKQVNVVSLVPSFWSAQEFYHFSKLVTRENFDLILQKMKRNEEYNLYVMANRYDGVDLADSMCRILMVDSLPFFSNLCDMYEQTCRENSKLVDVKIAQKIEQGLGRSVRGEKDYSVILILGPDLVRFMKSKKNYSFFSKQTICQIEIGNMVSNLAKNDCSTESALRALFDLIHQCINRDLSWKAVYKQLMNQKMGQQRELISKGIIDQLISEAEVEVAIKGRNFLGVIRKLEQLVKICQNPLDKGWYEQLRSKYLYLLSEQDYIQNQQIAHGYNLHVMIPNNYQYIKPNKVNATRTENIIKLFGSYDNFFDLKLEADTLCSHLSFYGMSSESFEAAINKLGEFLGYQVSRPDRESGKGPDNLWQSMNGTNYIIECKNSILMDRKTISKEESGQMSNHIAWYKEKFPESTNDVYIWIHPTHILSSLANISENIYVITPDKLELLCQRFSKYINEFQTLDIHALSHTTISKLLSIYAFTDKAFVQTYTVPMECEKG